MVIGSPTKWQRVARYILDDGFCTNRHLLELAWAFQGTGITFNISFNQ